MCWFLCPDTFIRSEEHPVYNQIVEKHEWSQRTAIHLVHAYNTGSKYPMTLDNYYVGKNILPKVRLIMDALRWLYVVRDIVRTVLVASKQQQQKTDKREKICN